MVQGLAAWGEGGRQRPAGRAWACSSFCLHRTKADGDGGGELGEVPVLGPRGPSRGQSSEGLRRGPSGRPGHQRWVCFLDIGAGAPRPATTKRREQCVMATVSSSAAHQGRLRRGGGRDRGSSGPDAECSVGPGLGRRCGGMSGLPEGCRPRLREPHSQEGASECEKGVSRAKCVGAEHRASV